MNLSQLKFDFFNRSCNLVAHDLIGKVLEFKEHSAYITETEAYLGDDDPASHAFRGMTKRNKPMFEKAGYTYIYLSYGIHYCLNISSDKEGRASAVLIRGIKMPSGLHLNGPGKLTKFLGLNKDEHGEKNICSQNSILKIHEDLDNKEKLNIDVTPRIGISKGKDLLYRFVLKD